MKNRSKLAGRRSRAGLLAVLALLIGAGLLYGADGEHAAPSRSAAIAERDPAGDPASIPVVATVDARLRDNFADLRTPPEGLPPALSEGMEPVFGANWALAQRLPADPSRQMWAVPGNGHLCLIDRSNRDGVSTTCTPVSQAIKHGIATTSLRDAAQGSTEGERMMLGLVPDQARRVRVRTRGFPTVTVPVVDGIVTLADTATEPPEILELVR